METAAILINIAQFLILLSAILAAVVYIHQDIRSHVSELKQDIKTQSERTDKLYTMFIELVKNK